MYELNDYEKEQKPFLTRFFEEVMAQVEVPYREFDFAKAAQVKDDTS